MDNGIYREINQHGANWGKLHNGYFADAGIGAPFIEKIKSAITISQPDGIADLGGGTGFILSLIENAVGPAAELVNIDISSRQLENLKGNGRIKNICKGLSDFKRADLGNEGKYLFIMRSALHYFGQDGLEPLLKQLRAQMKEGECFVHQTACFEDRRDCDCANMIYKMMNTAKWYPRAEQLHEILEKTGWKIESVSDAPKLTLSCEDLAERYCLDSEVIRQISNDTNKQYGQKKNVFELTQNGFCAYLHYKIFTCRAV
jgi:SAM-dependent methyltransferase